MTSSQMYELAKQAVIDHEKISPEDENQPDVLWVGGVMEQRRAVVWCGEKLFAVFYDTILRVTTVVGYVREE